VCALLLVAIAGCGGSGLRPERSWLAGEWVMMDGVVQHPLVCGSHGPITYKADGTYLLWGEVGTWRLDGNALTEAMTGFDPIHIDRSPADVGKPVVSKLEWTGRDRFLKRFASGNIREFLRCPRTR
jgi:hypothetical protein